MESSTALYFTSMQGLEASPFSGGQDVSDGQLSPRAAGKYEEIEQMWDDKWHGGLRRSCLWCCEVGGLGFGYVERKAKELERV